MLAALPLAAAPSAAHEADRLVPATDGIRLAAGLAVSQAQAADPWPAPLLPGILGSGNPPDDRRGGALEHATLEGAARADRLGAALAVGWHDRDPAHLETAWLQVDLQAELPSDPPSDPQAGGSASGGDIWTLGAGRRHLPMGGVLQGAGHFDRFAAMPLAKRAVIDGDWIDDGLLLRWQRSHHGAWPWLQTVHLGLWRGRTFPGSDDADPVPALHLRAVFGPVGLDGFAAALRMRQRGGLIQNPRTAHTHDPPDCNGGLTGTYCFDGRSDVLGGALTWALPVAGLRLELAGLLRRDRGLLYSVNGEADYRGSTGGGWLDLIWPLGERVSLAGRVEALRGAQTLTGSSALPVALDAGLMGSTHIRRLSAALNYALLPALRVGLELGSDRQGDTHNGYGVARLVWTPERVWGGAW